ncbi:unnamed protein product [Schistosoma mattheei]|uniref:Uncharacterized protein n=1 Tax=Schistosoma mattheei TaxID=31246 RepID=A0A183PP72_9TREM|nr:unnamed protein product [Schistosoma mattheei]
MFANVRRHTEQSINVTLPDEITTPRCANKQTRRTDLPTLVNTGKDIKPTKQANDYGARQKILATNRNYFARTYKPVNRFSSVDGDMDIQKVL